jgi:hypothetical protein
MKAGGKGWAKGKGTAGERLGREKGGEGHGKGGGKLEGGGRVGEREGLEGWDLALGTFRDVQEMGEGNPGYSATEGFGEGWK